MDCLAHSQVVVNLRIYIFEDFFVKKLRKVVQC